MSIEATWDLLANYSPRSVCLLSPPSAQPATPSGSSRNPFDTTPTTAAAASSSSKSKQEIVALVYGTERGSLHYRCYPVSVGRRGGTGASSRGSLSSSGNAAGTPQQPLGLSGTSTTSSIGGSSSRSTPLPRIYFPVDLKSPFLPGSIVSVIPCQSPQPAAFSYGNVNSSSWLFLVLVDDQRGTSAAHPGAYAAHWVSLHHGSFHVLNASLPRMSAAAVPPDSGLVYYTAGRGVACFVPPILQEDGSVLVTGSATRRIFASPSSLGRPLHFGKDVWPSAARSGSDALAIVAGGRVAVTCVGNAFYAAGGVESDDEPNNNSGAVESVKLIHLAQSSQVHPVLIVELPDPSLSADWTALFLANGRECAVVDLYYGPVSQPRISCDKPRTGTVTTASPILAASTAWPQLLVLLTSDGLVSVRSPSCPAVSLRTVECGTRPNDYFVLRSLTGSSDYSPWILSASYTGEARVLEGRVDTKQDLADRLMRHAIDAFGANGFPRTSLAAALQASFTATSYVGPEANAQARILLKDYLEALLGLCDWESGASSGWPTEYALQANSSAADSAHHGRFRLSKGGGRGEDAMSLSVALRKAVVTADEPVALLTATALLCLVATHLNPPAASVASRAAKSCAAQMGVMVSKGQNKGAAIMGMSSSTTIEMADAAVSLCEEVVEKLLRESLNFSLVTSTTQNPMTRIHRPSASTHSDFVEASIWLLRSCGHHEMAIQVASERLQPSPKNTLENAERRGLWSRIKYESYTATHLSELWASGNDDGRNIVLRSPATVRLLESNPPLGLSVFTAQHPQNEAQWRDINIRHDPLSQPEYAYQVVKLLKQLSPQVPYDKAVGEPGTSYDDGVLPLESGRALAVSYLESAIGLYSGRPTEDDEFDLLPEDTSHKEEVSNFHDELSFLLLEGVIAERSDAVSGDVDSDLGRIYRQRLRHFLRWPRCMIRPDQFMSSLPTSFLQEKALILGRLGRHDEALRILYNDLGSLDLALEYCDDRHNRQKVQEEKRARMVQQQQQQNMFADHEAQHAAAKLDKDNAYLPLIRVALDTDDAEKGCAAAIQVLALRRSAIDRAAAIRLLPSGIPVSAVARPFLIPALVDSESQVRRLTVVSALLRARYLRLKDELTAAQLKAQANLQVVPQLRSLNLGDPLHSTKPFRARTSGGSGTSTSPEVWIVKHFFPRHLVIQAKVTNQTTLSEKSSRTLSDIAFVVAESSEEAIQPLMQVPISVLPPKMTGSTWCVLSATPARMEGSTAQLTCELRYTAGQGDPSMMLPQSGVMGRTYVEELQDLEVHASHFS